MLGFRSGKLWKEVLSIIYLRFWRLLFVAIMFEGKFKNVTTHDYIIDKIFNLLIFVILIAPYIFLSKTKLRSKLPLFKANKAIKSILGLIIVYVVLFVSVGVVNSFHSQAYLADMANHAYRTTSQVMPTCENAGSKNYFCDYCGRTGTEKIPALGHSLKEASKTEATCDKEGVLVEACERCKYSAETMIPALGHSLKEASKTEATCDKEGVLVEACERCEYSTETIIPALGHSMKEKSKTEVTCESNGLIVKKCDTCGHAEENVLETSGHTMKEISSIKPTETTDGKIIRKCTVCGKEEIETLKKLGKTEEEYKSECKSFSYKEIARNPDNYVGNLAVFKGKVVQVQEIGKNVTIRMNVNGSWEDTIYIKYRRKDGESRILENDYITVYGELDGLETYMAVLGNLISIPRMKAQYIIVN